MSKGNIILVAALIIAAAGALVGGYFLVGRGGSTKGESPGQSVFTFPSNETKKLTYTDSSGFSFSYPEGISISDITPDGDMYYSVLSLTKGQAAMKISVKDTSSAKVSDWIEKDKEAPKAATLSGATTISGISASQYKAGPKLYTVAIDSGVLFLIEGEADGGFWEEAQNTVAASFKREGEDSSSVDSSQGGGDAIYEEEEIVE